MRHELFMCVKPIARPAAHKLKSLNQHKCQLNKHTNTHTRIHTHDNFRSLTPAKQTELESRVMAGKLT